MPDPNQYFRVPLPGGDLGVGLIFIIIFKGIPERLLTALVILWSERSLNAEPKSLRDFKFFDVSYLRSTNVGSVRKQKNPMCYHIGFGILK